MIVLDGSAAVELLLGTRLGVRVAELAVDGEWAAPEHFTVEVASALRGVWLAGMLSDDAYAAANQRLADLTIQSWPVRPLLPRMLELARNLTAYDAAYVALAEQLDVPLVTTDRRLSVAPSLRCLVQTPQPT